jgi:hypothetical protein
MTAFAGEPLPVEFCHADVWHPGVLLGWRHEWDGICQVRVQFVIGGLRRTTWMQLTDVRLPEPRYTEWAPELRQSPEPRTRPDVLLPGVGWSRSPASIPPLPQPRTHDQDLSRV